MKTKEEWIEGLVAKTEEEVYGGDMPAHNKARLREVLSKEHDFWERYEGREEEGHSNSAVGDLFNAGNE